ncbi:MAG: MOSC domain-containing protein [Pseudonocardia sp.]
MRIAELWRFPVKSLQGERVDAAELGPMGIVGDRGHALFDVATGFGLTARRDPVLLHAAARLRADGSVEITLPDGTVAADDDALSAWLGRPVRLRAAGEVAERRYENPDDIEHESAESWHPFLGASGAFHDAEGVTVTLLSRASMGGEPQRRFRANVVLEGSGDGSGNGTVEDAFVGSSVRVGGAFVEVTQQIARCVMVTRPQPGGIGTDREVLRRIHRERGGMLAVGGAVTRPGTARATDEVGPA